MLRSSTTKVIPKGNHTLLDEVAIAIEGLDGECLILDVLTDQVENEALIIYAYEENKDEEP